MRWHVLADPVCGEQKGQECGLYHTLLEHVSECRQVLADLLWLLDLAALLLNPGVNLPGLLRTDLRHKESRNLLGIEPNSPEQRQGNAARLQHDIHLPVRFLSYQLKGRVRSLQALIRL